jgi:hypothetical protein
VTSVTSGPVPSVAVVAAAVAGVIADPRR